MRKLTKILISSIGLIITAMASQSALAQPNPSIPLKPAFDSKTTRAGFTGVDDPQAQEVALTLQGGKVDGEPYGLVEIWIAEKGDEPCAIRAMFGALDKESSPTNRFYYSPDSGCVFGLPSEINLNAYDTPGADLNNDAYFISSVGTATNSKKSDRGFLVKGLSGGSTSIDTSGNVVRSAKLIPADMQPNGKHDTLTFSTCPENQIAMGLDVRVMPIGGKMSITGLQLRCKAVTGRIVTRDGFNGGSKVN